MPRNYRPSPRPEKPAPATPPPAARSVILALLFTLGACGGYSGPPDIETARQGLRPEYLVSYAGEEGKTVLELLGEHAESVRTEGEGDNVLVVAINGIDSGVEGRYWLYYVNEQAGLISANRMNTVQGDTVEWLFVR